ncbi:BTAD domain-containing putative transcriptional regulator [Pseudonocardia oroxyli]|uniref:Transcriptional regulatory protein, C terminal n=1 Tax=Pseudonocardia oroxyli TaxID=366584 RepID=A0A1G8CA57_PSEOR|nr:BTAD domain-containing putative transcriptional regulator [Pseudonocardia oroxyli]SDH42351.1 Transcriptional regulatory protein, C terminal [Pseudonocardia oroxyli]
MQFNVLGSIELRAAGEAVALGGVHQRATLGHLLLNANRTVATSRLVEALWGDAPPPTARKMLQNAVSGLRQRIAEAERAESTVGAGAGVGVEVLTRAPGYLLRVPETHVDLLRFQALCERGRTKLAEGDWAEAAQALRDGLALWRGPAFADLAEAGMDWPELVALGKARLSAFEDRVEAELALGRHQEMLPELEAACEADPARERLCGLLMLALYRSGRQTDALDVARRARSALRTEYGLDPGPELQELERAILHHDDALARPVEQAPARTETVVAPAELETVSERKWVSVLLVRAEPVGRADDDPEAVAERARELQAVLEAEVGIFGGTLHSRLGATWQAVFGLRRTHEDDAERAIRAACSIRRRLDDIDHIDGIDPIGGVIRSVGARTRVRIAVATGEALVTARAAGSGEVTGEVVDTCLQQLAGLRPGEVRVCATSRLASRGAVTYAEDGQVVGVRPEHESATFSGPFVGRAAETAMLTRLVDEVVRTRRPHAVTLFGEPGVGKSRLVREFRTAVAGEVRVVAGRTPRFGWNAPVTPLAGVVKECCGISSEDDVPTGLRKLTRAVHGLVGDARTAEWMVTGLRPLVELCESTRAPVEVEQVAAAWVRLVEESAVRRPLVVVLEDLQTADTELLDFVEGLDRRLGPVPVLVLVTARPELLRRRPAWAGGTSATTVRTMGPLSDGEVRELVGMLDRRLREESAPEGGGPALDCGSQVIDRVGGNPLFASEYVLMLRSDLAGRAPAIPTLTIPSADGGETGEPGNGRVRLPQSVHTILAARLDTLPQREKSVLQDAAVIGGRVWGEPVREMSGADQEEVAAVLDRLERHGLLVRSGRRTDTGELVYAFRHPLLRHVAVSQLRRQDRLERRARWRALRGGGLEVAVPAARGEVPAARLSG